MFEETAALDNDKTYKTDGTKTIFHNRIKSKDNESMCKQALWLVPAPPACTLNYHSNDESAHGNGWAGTVVDLDLENMPTKKSLGVTWEVEPDQLQFAMCKVNVGVPTKNTLCGKRAVWASY